MGSSGSVDEKEHHLCMWSPTVHTSWVLQQERSGHIRSVLVTGRFEPDEQSGGV